MIVGRDDRAAREPQRALAQPVVIAIDLPAGKMLLHMHRQPVRDRALAKILFEQQRFVRIEFPKRGYDLVELGLHLASDWNILGIANLLEHGLEKAGPALDAGWLEVLERIMLK